MARDSTNGQLVYAVGDIHGCYDHFAALLAQISLDAARRARGRRPILVFLGDFVDRGPQSAKVLQGLIWLQQRGDFELHLLKGNHEEALLQFVEAPEQAQPWLRFGGLETLQSYGVAAPAPEPEPAALIRARDELLQRMPAAHLRLLNRLSPCVSIGGYAFVHAGIRPGAPLARQAEHDFLWIREPFLNHPGPHEKVIVHGHSWTSAEPQVLAHRIGLDTGAYETGVLSGVMLDGPERQVLQAHAAR